MNKNFKNNDHESFIEGIYGCMERIEAGIIELQKVQPNKGNSATNDEDRIALVHEVKELVSNATGLNCRHTDRKLEEQTKTMNANFSVISESVKTIINKTNHQAKF